MTAVFVSYDTTISEGQHEFWIDPPVAAESWPDDVDDAERRAAYGSDDADAAVMNEGTLLRRSYRL